jgi:hypothetical protein
MRCGAPQVAATSDNNVPPPTRNTKGERAMNIKNIPSLDMGVGMPSSRTQNTLLEPITLAILIAIAVLDNAA